MDIVSLQFTALWLIAAVVYYIFPLKHRWLVLLASSVYFYVKSGLIGTAVMYSASLVVWLVALMLDKKAEAMKKYGEAAVIESIPISHGMRKKS